MAIGLAQDGSALLVLALGVQSAGTVMDIQTGGDFILLEPWL